MITVTRSDLHRKLRTKPPYEAKMKALPPRLKGELVAMAGRA